MRARYVCCVAIAVAGCSGDDPAQILVRWRHTSERPLTAAANGPEKRIVVSQRENPAQLVTLDEVSGLPIEGPYDVFPSLHAPVAVGTDLYLVSSVGRVVHTDLAGQSLAAPNVMLGLTAPPVAGADGLVRVASTAGRLVGVDREGMVVLDATFTGATDTAPAVDASGTTWIGTDVGTLVGIDGTGATVFEESLTPPVAGPSVRDGVVAVGTGDGVAVFDVGRMQRFTRARAARVTGTRILKGGEILAWGEDGAVELIDPGGGVIMSYSAGPPIYVEVVEVGDDFAVIDDDGTAHLVGRDGAARATLPLGGKAERQVVVGASVPFVFVTVGSELLAVDFTSRGG